MATAAETPASPIRETTVESISLAKTLVREARFGALAVIEPESGFPFSSRVAVATAPDGAPVILVSRLSGHTKGLLADPRCSILLGEPGKGDPLAHPRITLMAKARFLVRHTQEQEIAAARYLRRNPKASLYAGFVDFSFVRLEPEWASLNGGFGQAYRLAATDLLDDASAAAAIAQVEASAITHIKQDHPGTIESITAVNKHMANGSWHLVGIDSTGMDFTSGSKAARLWFENPVEAPKGLPGAISILYKR